MKTRYGAYGVIIQDDKILLTLKKSGPYKGLWGLPGGGIEFKESPEDALKREMVEETALVAEGVSLFMVATASVGEDFHQIGMIYRVANTTPVPLEPEEEMRWVELNGVKQEEITPFAKQALSMLSVIRSR